jgi:hypothetical protein
VVQRFSTRFSTISPDSLFALASRLQPQDWARLRLVSYMTLKALDAQRYRFQPRPNHAANPTAAERFHRLELGAPDMRRDHAAMVDGLIEASAWRDLRLNFASFKQSDQSDFKTFISGLVEALSRTPEGWSCHLEMDLQNCRESLDQLLSRMARSTKIGAFSIRCDIDPENLKFITQARAFERLQINLLETAEVQKLADALQASKARIRHLVLDGMPPNGDLDSLAKRLVGKGLESLTIPEWSGANIYNQMGLRQALFGFHFASFAKLELQALSLWAVAVEKDSAELQQLLDANAGLHSLSLSGHNFQHLESGLRHAIAHRTLLRQLHLKARFEQFPTELIRSTLTAPGLQQSSFEIQWDSASAHPAPSLPGMQADLRRQAYPRLPFRGSRTMTKPETATPVKTWPLHMMRNGDGRIAVPQIALPAPAFSALAADLACLAHIGSLQISHWQTRKPGSSGQFSLASQHRQSPAFCTLKELTLTGACEFFFADFPFDFNAQSALHLRFEQFDLSGFGAALADSTRLHALHLVGRFAPGSAEELLQGLLGNTSLRSLSADFHLGDLNEPLRVVRLIGAVLAHPAISEAVISLNNNALLDQCAKLKNNNKNIKLTFPRHFATENGNVANRPLDAESEKLILELIAQFAAATTNSATKPLRPSTST